MKKLVVSLLLSFVVFGMIFSPLIIAEDRNLTSNTNGSNSGNDSVSNNSGNSVVSTADKESNNKNETENNNETETENENESEVKALTKENNCTIEIEREIKVENGVRTEEIRKHLECEDGTSAEIQIKLENVTENGKVRERIKYGIEGEERDVEADEGIDLQEITNKTEYKLRARLRDGNFTDIKIMPDRASEIALERLKALNFTIELKEVTEGNIPHVVYNIETNKHGRFLGVFKLAMKVEGQVDPETGEFIGISKPWWAFLVSGEDSPDESLIEGGTEIKAETFNGTSEVKVEMEFGTNSTEKEQIVSEILSRLSDLNVSNLLEIEQSDKAIEDGSKMKVEAEVENDFTKVEFEWKFITGSDDRENITGTITTGLSQLTIGDINSILSLEVKNESEED